MDKNISVFNKYVSGFDKNNKDISLKIEHSFEVMKIMRDLANRLHLSTDDKYLAEVIGLLHDIGRFYQMYKFNSFKDSNMDHASYGIKLLFEDMFISKFDVLPNSYDIIKCAIINHNKESIESGLDENHLLFAKMIRDADKIDIFRVLKTRNKSEFKFTPSENVLDDFNNFRTVKVKDIVNRSDYVLMSMAFIYDINFKNSLEILDNNSYFIDWLSSILVNDKMKDSFFDAKVKVLSYFNRRGINRQ